ncbi:MAG: hypothetical protein CSA96_02260 [Bacteroidetes bacterium]|nr:MAG: hypothetical protein CSA96_02260 [Bacteroidota bacterium]
MKLFYRIAGLSAFAFFTSLTIHAQCEPDTANCKDTGQPGEFCPKELTELVVDVPFDETITVIPPDTFHYNGKDLVIIHVVVDSVTNLPPGLSYQTNAEVFYPDTAYCIQVSGTPTDTGVYTLRIYVSPTINYLGTPFPVGQVVDSTTVSITVHAPSGINPFAISDFRVLPNVPNPFRDVTRLGFFSPSPDLVKLQVFSILGKLVCEEKLEAQHGENHFRFNGGELEPGAYFYRIRNREAYHSGKILKSE